MTVTDKDQQRMNASILVKSILEWGGKGQDVAEYLGVSPTTISHWRSTGPESQRKPAVPTEEHITQLLGILKYRMEQNIFYLKQMIHLGAFDRKVATKVAISTRDVFQGMFEFLSEKEFENGKGLDQVFDQYKDVLDKGGANTFRSILEPATFWGEPSGPPEPTLEDVAEDPIDLDAIKASLRVSSEEVEAVNQEAKAYPKYFENKLRNKYLKPSGKGEE